MVAVPDTGPRPRGGVLVSAYALVGAIGLLTLVGALVALGTMRGGTSAGEAHHHAAAAARTDDIGHSVKTSFGAVSVETVEKLNGMTRKALGGMTHFPSYVPPNQIQVLVALELSNLESHTIDYSPRQFRLRVGNGRPIAWVRATLPTGTLQPSASVAGQLTFFAPRRNKGNEHLWLEFRDPGSKKPVRADMGLARTDGKVPVVDVRDKGHLNHQHPPP